jgi:hypothetical protein
MDKKDNRRACGFFYRGMLMKRYMLAMFAALLSMTVVTGSAYAGDFDLPPPSANSRIVYVSSSTGNDANNGYSATSAKRTLAAAKALMRNGFPDRMLLKEGDVWNESFGNWDKSGYSKAAPMVISYFRNLGATGGVNRPRINVPGQTGKGIGMWGNVPVKHLIINGLYFYGQNWNGVPDAQHSDIAEGIAIHAPTENIIISYNKFENLGHGVVLTNSGIKKNTGFFRNIFNENYVVGIASRGAAIYAQSCAGLRAEENIFRSSGHSAANPETETGQLIYRRAIYGQSDIGSTGTNCNGMKWFRNITFDNASNDQFRAGGVVIGNVWIKNAMGFLIGGGMTPQGGGVHATAMYNVITEGRDMPPSNYPVGHLNYHDHRRGWGLSLDNVSDGNVRENILTINNGTLPSGIHASEKNSGVRNVTFTGNIIHNWKAGMSVNGSVTNLGLQFIGNKVKLNDSASTFRFQNQSLLSGITGSGNLAMNTQTNGNNVQVGNNVTNLSALGLGQTGNPNFPNPSVSVGGYMATLGFQTSQQNSDAFINAAIANSKPEAWDDRFLAIKVVNHFRAGFGLPPRGQ